MKTIFAIVTFACVIVAAGCNNNIQPPRQSQHRRTVIIEKQVPVVPQQSRPKGGINIEINPGRPHHHCSPQHPCGRCDNCRRSGIRIDIK